MFSINRRTLTIAAVIAVGAVIAVSVFNVSLSTLGFLALIGFMFLMHSGHGGMHGGHQDDAGRDEHAGHAVESTRDENAKSIAAASNARGLASDDQELVPSLLGDHLVEPAKAVKPEESHQHHGCC